MRKSLLVLISVLVSIFVNAQEQQIQNGDFELWSSIFLYENPVGWSSSNTNEFMGTPLVIKSEDAYSGDYSIKLKNYVIEEDTLSGYIFLGIAGEDGPEGGVEYSSDFDQVKGYYKSNLLDEDTAIILVVKYLNSVPTFFHGSFEGVQEEWTEFVFDLPPVECDSVFIGFVSANLFQDDLEINPDSWIMFDDISFVNTIGEDVPEPIINNGFEEWEEVSFENPDYWYSFNSFLAGLGQQAVRQTTDAFIGLTAVEIETLLVMGVHEFPGLLSIGPVDFDSITPIEYFHQPIAFSGYYKYEPSEIDTAFVWIEFRKDSEIVAVNYVALFENEEYELFTVNLSFIDEPDQLRLVFSSGTNVGSILKLDNISFDFDVEIETINKQDELAFYPNPVKGLLNIEYLNSEDRVLTVEIFDIHSRIVFKDQLYPGNNNVSFCTKHLNKGMYFIRINSDKTAVSKIIVE